MPPLREKKERNEQYTLPTTREPGTGGGRNKYKIIHFFKES